MSTSLIARKQNQHVKHDHIQILSILKVLHKILAVHEWYQEAFTWSCLHSKS